MRGFSPADHARLAEMLRLTPHRWVLTYGDHPRIRMLYEWARIETLGERELLITPMPVKSDECVWAAARRKVDLTQADLASHLLLKPAAEPLHVGFRPTPPEPLQNRDAAQ